MNAQIPVKTYRKIVKRFIPVQDLATGQRKSLPLFEINGVPLIPVSKSRQYVGVPSSTIRNYINDGKLKTYTANGKLKTGGGSQRTYFNLNEYLDL